MQIVLHAKEHSIKAATRVFKTTVKTVRKWFRKWEEYGYA
ncbi:MAG: helix-turn-helix domain-containing protein [bacterium]